MCCGWLTGRRYSAERRSLGSRASGLALRSACSIRRARERPELCGDGGRVMSRRRSVLSTRCWAHDGLAAASQGTMNNSALRRCNVWLLRKRFCGGSRVTASEPTLRRRAYAQLTNTRLTDPEILERRYPVRLLEFSIRRGSGGRGVHRGGDGGGSCILEFLCPLEAFRFLFAPLRTASPLRDGRRRGGRARAKYACSARDVHRLISAHRINSRSLPGSTF